ncbi:MAG TPA: hypothetical protein VIP77_17020 [Jiangellaceae bacterium]
MDDRLPTRPYVAKAVRLLSQPRRSPADSALVTAVALRLAAFDSDSETSERLAAASDRVIAGVAGLVGEQSPASDWSDTAEALALMIAGRPLQRGHLMAARSALGSADKVIDLSDRLRRTAEEPLDRDDLGRALALAVTGPAELVEALIEKETAEVAAEKPRSGARRAASAERNNVSLRALDGGVPGR